MLISYTHTAKPLSFCLSSDQVLTTLKSVGRTPILKAKPKPSSSQKDSSSGSLANTKLGSRTSIGKGIKLSGRKSKVGQLETQLTGGISAGAAAVRQAISPEFQRVFALTGETGSHT